jgi:hypothetical protein
MFDDNDPDYDEDEERMISELTPEELTHLIQHSLRYLVTEGVVVQSGDRYRLKTEEEIEQELRDIEDS